MNANGDHATCRWIVEDGQVVGAVALRHQLDERTGHIGYGVRPSARGRGLATWALATILDVARQRVLARVLVVCDAGNAASVRTIEANGGRLAEVRDTPGGSIRRYWIELPLRDGSPVEKIAPRAL